MFGLNRRRFVISLAAGVSATAATSALTGCVMRKFRPYRYRLTLMVQRADTVHSGSSVVEVRTVISQSVDAGAMRNTQVIGEAACVDLGNGKILLGLLCGAEENRLWRDNPTLLLEHLYGLPDTRDSVDLLSMQSGVRVLSKDEMPFLITFENDQEPSTYKMVDPNNPQATLGKDVGNVAATLEITSARVTKYLHKRLKWVNSNMNYLSESDIRNQVNDPVQLAYIVQR